jgi:hypothetical protein
MVIEETIFIHAPLQRVWETFTDLSCYSKWNTVMENPSAEYPTMREGMKYRCALRPFAFPISIEPFVAEFSPHKKIVLTGSKFGVTARHEFIFDESGQGTSVTSREFFGGITFFALWFAFPAWRIRELTQTLLQDLKKTTEHS